MLFAVCADKMSLRLLNIRTTLHRYPLFADYTIRSGKNLALLLGGPPFFTAEATGCPLPATLVWQWCLHHLRQSNGFGKNTFEDPVSSTEADAAVLCRAQPAPRKSGGPTTAPNAPTRCSCIICTAPWLAQSPAVGPRHHVYDNVGPGLRCDITAATCYMKTTL
jgi:hypothetical protein